MNRLLRSKCGTLYLGVVLSAPILVNSAHADFVVDEVRGWQIIVSDEYKGCISAARYRDGTIVRFGFDGLSGAQFLNLSNQAWSAYPTKQNFELRFDFDRAGTFSGYFHTVLRGGWVTFENGELTRVFLDALAASARVRVSVEGRALTSLELSGTRSALSKLNDCTRRNAR
jgi:hypothetical protein